MDERKGEVDQSGTKFHLDREISFSELPQEMLSVVSGNALLQSHQENVHPFLKHCTAGSNTALYTI